MKARDNGVAAVETAFAVLRPLLAGGEALTLSAIAHAAGIPAAKVHRYLVSLIRVGMVAQDASSGRYDLGPAAVRFGVASLGRFDPVRHATSELEALRDDIGETVSLIVWSDAGPTVVRTENSRNDVAVTMRVGTVLPLAKSACGRLFLSYLPEDRIASAGVGERARKSIASDAKRRGCARTIGGVLSGVSGLAAPIFDDAGAIVAAVTAYGPSPVFDASWDGRLANALRAFAGNLSSLPRFRSS